MKKTTFLISGVLAFASLSAQTANDDKVEVLYPTSFQITRPLSEIAELFPYEDNISTSEMTESKDREHRQPQIFKYSVKDGPEYGNDPASIQTKMGTRAPIPTIVNWAGQNGGGYPPDPSGAVGPNHYVQAVNATPIKIFNKTTGANILTTTIGALLGTANDGDPIIMYDKYADRWFISQFGVSGNRIFIGISQTNNPAGSYYAYTFTSPQFPDYLKFSIWENGYYMSSNQSTDKMFCFERAQMLIGNPSARAINRNFTTGAVSGFFCPLPADAGDDVLPPVGTPLPFFSYYENAWGGGVDAVKIWSMDVDWLATPTAVITGPVVLPTASFDGTYNASWNDIDQPGTSAKLDGIGGVVTYRSQFRTWTGYNTVCLNWGVKMGGTQRSIKWVELRQNQATGVWSIFQEGIYSPDSKSRWVGSISMDDNGSIALCYARASSAAGDFASLGFTGRLASDAPGTMSFAETMVINGTNAQTSNNRFGDYSHTSLDPVDGVTFWHTGEYLGTGPRTRIYSFQLPLTTGVEEGTSTAINLTAYQNGTMLMVNGSKLGSDEQVVLDLFDVTGKKIEGKVLTPSGHALETTFDVSGLSAGTYLVRIGRTNQPFQKVIKVALTK